MAAAIVAVTAKVTANSNINGDGSSSGDEVVATAMVVAMTKSAARRRDSGGGLWTGRQSSLPLLDRAANDVCVDQTQVWTQAQ